MTTTPTGLTRAQQILHRMEAPPAGGESPASIIDRIGAQAAHAHAIAAVEQARAAELSALISLIGSEAANALTSDEYRLVTRTIRTLLGLPADIPKGGTR